ncbi:methylaspartate mutase subunit S [Streptomyces sp. NPDC058371]|uniref:methylaspartate mutase subunit S n=1 Tax=Streptomyces sp. NPDC058371 TaxID=3346463 RepID=UPI00365A4910
MSNGSAEEFRGQTPAGVALGVIGHDIHVVANRVLAHGLAENGFRVFNIGTNTRIEDFVDATLETGSRAVLVSSINGEGETACVDIGRIFAEHGLADVLLYAGGNLVVGDRPAEEVHRIFAGYGFHRVFHRPPDFHGVFHALRQDLNHGNAH